MPDTVSKGLLTLWLKGWSDANIGLACSESRRDVASGLGDLGPSALVPGAAGWPLPVQRLGRTVGLRLIGAALGTKTIRDALCR
jgi:hypothetical protein